MIKHKISKCKGGAEKLREKKRQAFEAEANKCVKINLLFAGRPAKHLGEDVSRAARTAENILCLLSCICDIICVHSQARPSGSTLEDSGEERGHEAGEECEEESGDESRQEREERKKEETGGRRENKRQRKREETGERRQRKRKIVQKVFWCKDGTNRRWLTYHQQRHALHCSVCIAFAKSTDKSPFISGMTDWKHVHQRLEEHEKSVSHKTCAEVYFLNASKSDVKYLLSGSQLSSHRKQIRKKRQVLERVVDVVKMIGKRGLNYRSQNEAAYMLDDCNIDHGNFLEVIVLLSKYDVCLKEHLKECIEKSKKIHQTGAKGRGSLVSLLSPKTVITKTGQYKGFSTQMSKVSPNQVHVWCYAHVLNLVLADTTQTVIESGSLFTVLNDIAVFFRESHKRMNVWENESQGKHQKRLSPIRETRWWAKDNALRKVFGSFANPHNCLYVDIILALTAIQEDMTMKTTARIQARGFVESNPRNFTQLESSSLPPLMFQELSKCLLRFDSEATAENLQCEFSNFALQWEKLKMYPLDEYKVKTLEDKNEDGGVEIRCKECPSCNECPLCCYQILRRFNLMSNAYHLLGLAYKFLLTLSITQVACERTFSLLKFIKTRLRSKLSQEHLEAFMLMATERDILFSLDSDVIIDKVAEKSELFTKLLL
ncbi:Zinc finger MYM-type protein 1 [Labeo rohita]|uniref:Zinc finger MYM-type protein 1 n=1 Tax=Labeo rohita TaxID=84645 RepID=A0ABQ8MUD5_LABRO|nr:Zinc finger MYM-type protein 1 [Labeo rohita]